MPSFCDETISEIRDKEIKSEKDGEVIDYKTEEIGQFSIKTHPLGFRGVLRKIKYLRNLLYSVPYITGSVPEFRLIVEHTSNIGVIPFTVFISQERDGEAMPTILYPSKSTEGQYIKDIKAPKIVISGQYRYYTALKSKVTAPCNCDIVVFKAVAQENVTLVIYGVLLGFVSSFFTWLLTSC